VSAFVLTRHLTNRERSAAGDVCEEIDGIVVHRLCFGSQRFGLPYSLRVAMFLWKQRKAFDIVHCHGIFWTTYVGILLAWLLGKASLAKATQFGTDDLRAIKRRRFGWLQALLLGRADRVIAISHELENAFAASPVFAGKVVHLPNGVDTATFWPSGDPVALRRRLGLPGDAMLTAFSGIMKRRKGVDTLVEAWIKLAGRSPKLVLVLIGPCDASSRGGTAEVEYVAALRQRIADAGLAERVYWVGQVFDVVPYLQACDIFVLPSLREGLPNALLEAMACARPCIASRLDSVQEIMRPGTGLMFEPEDVDALAAHLSALADDRPRREALGAAAREWMECAFSLQAVAKRYIALYDELNEDEQTKGALAA
jgi:glycosyltransferase involved in cell wall biosynthesis